MPPQAKGTAGHTPARGRAHTRSSLPPSSPDSSPDPLQASFTSHQKSPARARVPQSPLVYTSPSKQNRTTSQVLQFSPSPSKSMVMTAPRAGDASPWRIKVTVQAEPGSEDENAQSPSVKHVERRMTTTVPLKGGDDASSPAKRRGRPRKSDTGTSAGMRRPPTPVRKRRVQKSPQKGGAAVEEDATVVAPGDVSPPKKRRGRPRKSVQSEDVFTTEEEDEREQEPRSDATVTFADPETVESMADDIIADIDASTATPAPRSILKKASRILSGGNSYVSRSAMLDDYEDYEEDVHLDTPRQTDLRNQFKGRKGTPHAKKAVVALSSASEDGSDVDTPPGTEDEAQPSHPDTDGIDNTRAMEFELEALRNDPYPNDDSSDDDHVPEATVNLPEDTTMFAGEDFSMISVESLPSMKATTPVVANTAANKENKEPSLLRIATAASSSSRQSPRPKPSFISLPKPTYPVLPAQQLVTPAVEASEPAQPPPLAPTRSSPHPEPSLKGSAIQAGFALQNLVVTPAAEQSQKKSLDDPFLGLSDRSRKQLHEGLQLGEQLSLEPADAPTSRRPSPGTPRAKRPGPSPLQSYNDDVFSPARAGRAEDQSQDPYALAAPPSLLEETEAEVNYPSLPAPASENTSQLVSPEMSDHEMDMDMEVDSAPVRAESSTAGTMLTAYNEHGQQIRGSDIMFETIQRQGRNIVTAERKGSTGEQIQGEDIVVVAREENEALDEGFHSEDIWVEEASRTSLNYGKATQDLEYGGEKEELPKLYDFFGKSPRDKSRRNFQQSSVVDEEEEEEEDDEPVQQLTPSESEESQERSPPTVDLGKGKMPEVAVDHSRNLHSETSVASDDTGVFFQPQGFQSRFQEQKAAKLSMSDLLYDEGSEEPEEPSSPMHGVEDQGETVQEQQSSPTSVSAATSSPRRAGRTPLNDKPNPFKKTPPQFAYPSIPARSSPLRQEYRASDTEESFQNNTSVVEGSTIQASSPFHTQVDNSVNISGISIASHEQQLRYEMEGRADDSLRDLREEADAHADAYSMQYRSLHDITEVTEPSRSRIELEQSRAYPSSPPQRMTAVDEEDSEMIDEEEEEEDELSDEEMEQEQVETSGAVEDSILRSRQAYTPLPVRHPKPLPSSSVPQPQRRQVRKQEPVVAVAPSVSSSSSSSSEKSEAPAAQPKATATSTGLLSRLTSTLFRGSEATTAIPTKPKPEPQSHAQAQAQSEHGHEGEGDEPFHPIAAKYLPLPSTLPWTRTHYLTLNSLYKLHNRDPSLFSPSPNPNASNPDLHHLNAHLLRTFLAAESHPFLHSTYRCWGYSAPITPSLLVLASVFLSLLQLEDIDEYEHVTGREIDMGDCNPGEEGVRISDAEIVKRVASLIMGDRLRADEERGVPVFRRGALVVSWGGWGEQVWDVEG